MRIIIIRFLKRLIIYTYKLEFSHAWCNFLSFHFYLLGWLSFIVVLVMAPKPHWSRDYFTKQANGKFHCNFGCGAKYNENVTTLQHYLLVSHHFKQFLSLFRISAKRSDRKLAQRSTKKPDASQTLFSRQSSRCSRWSRSRVQQLSVIGQFGGPFAQKSGIDKLILVNSYNFKMCLVWQLRWHPCWLTSNTIWYSSIRICSRLIVDAKPIHLRAKFLAKLPQMTSLLKIVN